MTKVASMTRVRSQTNGAFQLRAQPHLVRPQSVKCKRRLSMLYPLFVTCIAVYLPKRPRYGQISHYQQCHMQAFLTLEANLQIIQGSSKAVLKLVSWSGLYTPLLGLLGGQIGGVVLQRTPNSDKSTVVQHVDMPLYYILLQSFMVYTLQGSFH